MKPRVAVLTWKSPYPIRGGLDLRIDGICRFLSRSFDVHLICIQGANFHTRPTYIEKIISFPREEAPTNQEILKWGIVNPSDPLGVFVSAKKITFLQKTLKDLSPIFVIVSRLLCWRLFSEMDCDLKTQGILDLDETSSRISRSFRQASNENEHLKLIVRFHTKNIPYEVKSIREASLVLVSSNLESVECQNWIEKEKIVIVPNVVEECIVRRKWTFVRKKVIFPGNFFYEPNRSAMDFIIRELCPRNPSFTFLITGSGLNTEVRNLPENLTLKPFPSDMNLEFENADFLVAPITYGAGTRLKIIEAMNRETIVIGTSFAVEGLNLKENEHYICANAPEQFTSALNWLSSDLSKCKSIAWNAKKLVNEHFTLQALEEPFRRFLKKYE